MYQPMLTKVGNPSCLEAEVSKGMLSVKKQSTENYFMKEFVLEMASSLWQLFNGQVCKESLSYKI